MTQSVHQVGLLVLGSFSIEAALLSVAATCMAATGLLEGALSCCAAESCSTFRPATMAIACGCITVLLR